MLILSRKPEESICIGDDIKITVLAIHGRQVRIGIVAPTKLPVHRQEIYDKVHGNKPGCVQVAPIENAPAAPETPFQIHSQPDDDVDLIGG